MEPKGKTAVITGAASGIGRATAQRLASAGALIVVADLDASMGAETVKLIETAGGSATFVKVEVTDADDAQRMLDTAVSNYGGVDILYNNAGIAVGSPPFPRSELRRWRRVLDIDLQAVVLGTYLAASIMERQGGGVIINTASMAGLLPLQGRSGLRCRQGRRGQLHTFARTLGRAAQYPRQLRMPRRGRHTARTQGY